MNADRPPDSDPVPTRADSITDLPQQCWASKAQRRYVVEERVTRGIFHDDSMVTLSWRWLDEDETHRITVEACYLLQRIGIHDWSPESHPDLWRRCADPDGWADDDERKARRFGVLR